MADPSTPALDEIERSLDDHEAVIASIEAYSEKRAAMGVAPLDPTRLLAIRDRVRRHTTRLNALLLKFPSMPS